MDKNIPPSVSQIFLDSLTQHPGQFLKAQVAVIDDDDCCYNFTLTRVRLGKQEGWQTSQEDIPEYIFQTAADSLFDKWGHYPTVDLSSGCLLEITWFDPNSRDIQGKLSLPK